MGDARPKDTGPEMDKNLDFLIPSDSLFISISFRINAQGLVGVLPSKNILGSSFNSTRNSGYSFPSSIIKERYHALSFGSITEVENLSVVKPLG